MYSGAWSGTTRALSILLAVQLPACGGPATEHRAEYAVFGTAVELTLRGSDDATADSVMREAGEMLERMHVDLHPWQDGMQMDVNSALAIGRDVSVSPDLAELIRAGQRLERSSRGTFNPAIGALVNLWGFHTSDYPITRPPPDPAEIEALVAEQPSMRQLVLLDAVLRTSNPAVRLDFSGLAKGLAARQICELVARQHIASAMINLGGDVMVCAVAREPWRVAIRAPDGGVLEILEVDRPLAVFTSGNYYRYGDFDGRRYAHILDPNTGRPVEEVMQATAIDPDPLKADAAATALVVAGTAHWRKIAESMQVEQAMVVDATGQVSHLR